MMPNTPPPNSGFVDVQKLSLSSLHRLDGHDWTQCRSAEAASGGGEVAATSQAPDNHAAELLQYQFITGSEFV
jgi:hypothetical protein